MSPCPDCARKDKCVTTCKKFMEYALSDEPQKLLDGRYKKPAGKRLLPMLFRKTRPELK